MASFSSAELREEHRRQRELQLYFDEAALLRTCLTYNEDDHRFATENNGRIVYLFDANIVAFFLQPERENERRKVLAFGSDTTSLDYASSTALITAEFLFSRELAGQRGNSPLICPSHGDDLGALLSAMKNERPEETAEVRGELQELLKSVVNRVNRRDYRDIRSIAQELRTFVPTLADELEGVWEPLAHFRRIYDEDLLRPLAIHSAATREILEPDSGEVRRWSKRIHDERLKRPRAALRSNEERDAKALIQTMLLDKAAQQRFARANEDHAERMRRHLAVPDAREAPPPPPEPERYVMVTADQSLFDAYVRWYWNDRLEEDARFVLRLPLQYVPIINTAEMPNSINSDELTLKAFVALDSLFGNLQQLEPNYTQKLAQYRIMNSEAGDRRSLLTDYFRGIDAFSLDHDAFKRVRASWHACYQNGTVLNASLMAKRHRKELDGLVGALRSNSDLRTALTADSAESLDRIVGVHAEFTTHGNINTILKGLHDGGSGVIPRRRVPFLVRLDRAEVPATIMRLLEGNATKTDEEAIQQELRDALGAAQSDRSLLLAAVIAFRRAHWIGARALAHHGLTLDPSPSLRSELAYLETASIRYVLGTLQERVLRKQSIDAARTSLRDMRAAAEREDDSFSIARASVEEQALGLTVVRRLAYQAADPSFDDYTARAIFDETVALDLFASEDDEPLASALADLRATVILGSGVSDWLARAEPAETALRHMAAALAVLAHSTSNAGEGAPIHIAYRFVTEWLIGSRTLSDAATHVARLRRTEVGDIWRSPLDQVDIGRMADALQLRQLGAVA